MNQIAQSACQTTPTTMHSGALGEIMGMPLTVHMSMMASDVEQAANTDEMFLMMIPHHGSAISMADEERKNGGNAELKALADSIVTDQARESGQMQQMLTTL